MAHVVTERCVDCRYTDCCAVCPVDCFYEVESPAMLVIDPDTCIDCALCVPECPIQAIWPEDELPEEYSEWVEKNAELFESGTQITTQKDALPTAKSLAEIQQAEKERGWAIKGPSAAAGEASKEEGTTDTATADADDEEAAPSEDKASGEPAEKAEAEPSVKAAESKKPKRTPSFRPAAKKVDVPDELGGTLVKVYDAAANTIYHWRTIRSLAQQVKLPQGTVQADLKKLIDLGYVKERKPDTKGVTVYGVKARVAA